MRAYVSAIPGAWCSEPGFGRWSPGSQTAAELGHSARKKSSTA